MPDAHRTAIAIITFPMRLLPSDALFVSHPDDAIITHPTKIPPKQINKRNVIIIFVSAHIRIGNAVASVTTVVSELSASFQNEIHLPIKGTFVLSLTQQHTHGVSHDLQTQSTFVKSPSQVHLSVTGWSFPHDCVEDSSTFVVHSAHACIGDPLHVQVQLLSVVAHVQHLFTTHCPRTSSSFSHFPSCQLVQLGHTQR